MQNSLNPNSFSEYIGQAKLVETIKVMLSSAEKQAKLLDHILFYGAPGLGKTSLAKVIGLSSKRIIRYAQGPMLEKKSDILSLFSSIGLNEIIFIDEIHGINKQIEELLYSALESGFIDIIIGAEGDSKIMRIKLPSFTLIGATTKINLISKPLRDRFGLVGKLAIYSDNEMLKIIRQSAKALNLAIETEALNLIVNYSSNVPRQANNLLKRILDFKIVANLDSVNLKFVKQVFQKIGVFEHGLHLEHMTYLKALASDFHGNWISLESICSIISESRDSVEREIEPFLLRLGFIRKSSRGRKITDAGLGFLDGHKM